MKKILLVCSQHGNELFGDVLLTYIRHNYPKLLKNIETILANPRAYAENVRFIETDMNRSYVDSPKSYEEKRATLLCRKIKDESFSLVLDLHTTTTKQPACFIVKDITVENTMFLRASHITKIVLMQHEIVKLSLNAKFPSVISVEVYKDALTATFLKSFCEDIIRFLKQEDSKVYKNTYTVNDLLLKKDLNERDRLKLINFRKSAYGYYPVLIGEDAYKTYTPYLGFKASKMERIKL